MDCTKELEEFLRDIDCLKPITEFTSRVSIFDVLGLKDILHTSKSKIILQGGDLYCQLFLVPLRNVLFLVMVFLNRRDTVPT